MSINIGKVLLSVICVCHSFHRGSGVPEKGPNPSTGLIPLCTGLQLLPPDMLKLIQLRPNCTGPQPTPCPHPTLETFKLVHYETRTVGKRVVGIRLKCILLLILVLSLSMLP